MKITCQEVYKFIVEQKIFFKYQLLKIKNEKNIIRDCYSFGKHWM
jgi:hypothetical protein